MLLIVLIPAIGLFRIDLTTASFTVFERQIWWSNFFLVFGLAIITATAPIITYMTIGTTWCGWACPQNTLVEWANGLTRRLLGKRASVDVEGDGLIVATAKNKVLNWIVLGLSFLAVSLVLGVIPFFYFYPPDVVWSFVTFQLDSQLTRFMHRLYFVTVVIIFLDIAVIRYFWCDYFCLYRMGQMIFGSKDALHVAYDAERSSDCAKCNYCAASCVTGIAPTEIKITDRCIDCGECIEACNRLHEKSGTTGLLRFEFGEKKPSNTWRDFLGNIFARFNWWVSGLFLIGCAMFVWGIVVQKPIPVQIPLAEQQKAQRIAQVCTAQCAPQQSSCKGGALSACFSLAACKCACSLEQDPSSPSSGEWRQCIKKNNESAAGSANAGKTSPSDNVPH